MASTTISDVSEARWARDLYSATLARLSLPELPYFVPGVNSQHPDSLGLTGYHNALSAASNILQRALPGASRCTAELLGGAAILSVHSAQPGQQDMP
jgi:hypothetical protein